jgi:hypothetical protein
LNLPFSYPVAVEDDSPVLDGLEILQLPDRDPRLPPIYVFPEPHPAHRLRIARSVTYVYLVDPSNDGKAIFDGLSQTQSVPNGLNSSQYRPTCYYRALVVHWCIGLKGYLELHPGDAVLARPVDKGGRVSDDTLQILVGVKWVLLSNSSN